ncbi:MAG TPA: TonB-dependent receptor [Micropepsaceae bacterium]|nr:TonB-dependent receptor [Micropepsaceae bacterium]
MRGLVLVFLLLPAGALADEPALSDNLETVVVSATRSEQPRELTGTSVSVISAADIVVQHLNIVTDALSQTPGLTVVRNGGPGQFTSIGLRDAEAGQTLVVVDGMRIMDPSATDGTAILSDVLVNSIDRIEVLRGPQSTLYGSDAIGGVVNILTRRGGTTPFAMVTTAEGGGFGTYRLNSAANGTVDGIEYGGGFNLYTTEGIAAADTRPVRDQPDPYRNVGATANVRVPLAANINVDARGWYVNARTVFDGFPPPDFTLQYTGEYGIDSLLALYGGVNAAFFDGRFVNRLSVSDFDSDRRNYNPGLSFPEEFYAKGTATNFEYQGIFDVTPSSQLTFGAESLHTAIRTASPAPGDTNPLPVVGHDTINSIYAQYQATLFDQLTLTGGYRHDDDSSFGGHDSIKGAVALALFGRDTILRGNYGDGFKAPSLYELYSPFSNPVQRLTPESARGWEAGVDQMLSAGGLISVAYFQRLTSDQIDFFDCFDVTSPACAQRPFGYYANIVKTRSSGVEVEGGAQLMDTIHVYANFTAMDAVDLSTGNELARRPRLMANARVVWTPDARWSLGMSAGFTGKRFDDAFETVPLRAFTLLDVFASYAISDRMQVYLRGENLLDEHYETAAGYRSLPLTVTAGLRFGV